MNVFEKLTYGFAYNADGSFVDLDVWNFVNALSIGSDDWVRHWITVAVAIIFGLLGYIVPVIQMQNEHAQTYPLWVHCLYCATDFMGIWVFLHAWVISDHFLFFLLMTISECAWFAMEIYCLYRTVTWEHSIIWKEGTSRKTMVLQIVSMVIIFYAGLNMLRFEWHDITLWKEWSFMNIFAVIGPMFELKRRGFRSGNSYLMWFVWVGICFVTFNPIDNMWKVINPEFFSFSANPWYYIMGIVCLCCGLYGLYTYHKLPPKEDILGSGKKPLLK